jgi:hypothetical protein
MNVITLLAWLWVILNLPVAQESQLSLTASAGFDRLYKESAAVPVYVVARNDGPPVEGEIRVTTGGDGDGLRYTAPISLPTQSDKRVALYVHMPAFGRQLTVELVNNDQVIATTPVNPLNLVGPDDILYGVVSSNPGALAYLETIAGGRPGAAVAFLALEDLPDVSSGWNALDILVLDDIDTSRLTTAQLAGLQAWVESGGQLVVTGGPGGPQTAAGVADLLPVGVIGTETLTDLQALSEFGGSPFISQGPYVIASSTIRDGEILLQEDDHPLLARRQVGLGNVYFLALDPKLVPMAGWPGVEQVWGSIASQIPSPPPWGSGFQDGYTATQAVSTIPGLSLPSVIQLSLFLLIYIAVIGPVNFFILKRLNRRELAWLTIPLLVLLFSALTLFTSFRTRGNSATLVQMAAAYGSIRAERLSTQTAIGLYSPRRNQYNLGLPYNSTAFPLTQEFGSLQGSGNLEAIDRAGDLTLQAIRTDTGEIATFLADAHLPRPEINAEAELADEGRTVVVTIRNEDQAIFEDAVLIYGENQIALGDLPPGETRTQRLLLSTGTPSAETPAPLFAGGSVQPNPLVNDPAYILGTSDYFNDPVVFPRWQLIQSLYNNAGTGLTTLPDPSVTITLGGWLAESRLPIEIDAADWEQSATTLYLLEIPVE